MEYTQDQTDRLDDIRRRVIQCTADRRTQPYLDLLNELVSVHLQIEREQITTELINALNVKTWTPQWGRDDWRVWLKDQMKTGPVEPIKPGWYAYSGGAQTMLFLLHSGLWSVHSDNGTVSPCDWGYIEQGLGVWDLVPLQDVL